MLRLLLRHLRIGVVVTTAAVGTIALAAPVAQAADPTYAVTVTNGSFETPAVANRTDVYNPTGGSWLFGGEAGISRSGSTLTSGAPTFPDGLQVAFVRRAGKIVLPVWLSPGDEVSFRAVQRAGFFSSNQSLSLVIDGVRQGPTITPSRTAWTTYTVPVSVGAAPREVNLEIRGLVTSSDVTALIDTVSITRVASAIPDTGLPAETQRPVMDTRTSPMAAGVLGVLKTGDSEPSVDTPVQAFAEWTNPVTGQAIIFVGGKFSHVQRGAGAPQTAHPYLAAFDRSTGAWIDTFRPRLDGTVWDLAIADGKLIVGGQFTNVNGEARTAGVAALDPATGAVVAGWRASLSLTSGTTRAFARAVKVVDNAIYIGGTFNRVTGPDGTVRTAGNLDKLNAANGVPVTNWNGTVNGQVYDIDATPTRVYAVGKFSTVNGVARRSNAVLEATNGASVPGMKQMLFTTTDTSRQYQQAVHVVGDVVAIGGSEHSTQIYTASDFTRLRIVTTDPYGDTQAITSYGGYLYFGNHANPQTFAYTDAANWPSPSGWTTRDAMKWIGSLDLESNYSFVAPWVPAVGVASGEGGWELFVDSTGCMWAGGDFDRGSSTSNGYQYAQGFTKFCSVDTVAPSTPGNATATPGVGGVTVSWGASIDDRVGTIRFEVLRNDRPIATGLTTRTFTDPAGTVSDRYFVRAIDPAGNRSASTRVLVAGVDDLRPTTPGNLTVVPGADGEAVLTWTASSDNIGVTGYRIFREGSFVTTSTTTTATVTGLPRGSTSFQVSAVDAAGNESLRTASVSVDVSGPDTDAPSVPRDLVGSSPAVGEVALSWTASNDDVGVAEYRVYRNSVLLQSTTLTTLSLTGQPGGPTSFQVSAVDAAGNESARTASVSVTVLSLDASRPSSPKNLVIVPGADNEAVLTWSPSTDNVGVVGYRVYRSGVLVATVTDVTATVTGLPTGSNSFQVSAIDAAGNESAKTASVTVMVTGVDVTNPSTPKNLAAALQPDGSVLLTWSASSDNVGVVGYSVFQKGVLVQTVTTPTATIVGLAPGSYSFQVQAFDATGNVSLKTASVSVTL